MKLRLIDGGAGDSADPEDGEYEDEDEGGLDDAPTTLSKLSELDIDSAVSSIESLDGLAAQHQKAQQAKQAAPQQEPPQRNTPRGYGPPPKSDDANRSSRAIQPPQQDANRSSRGIIAPLPDDGSHRRLVAPQHPDANRSSRGIQAPQQPDANRSSRGIQPPQQQDANRSSRGIQPPQQDANRSSRGIQPPQQQDANRSSRGIVAPTDDRSSRRIVMPQQQDANRSARGIMPPQQDDANRSARGLMPPQPSPSTTLPGIHRERPSQPQVVPPVAQEDWNPGKTIIGPPPIAQPNIVVTSRPMAPVLPRPTPSPMLPPMAPQRNTQHVATQHPGRGLRIAAALIVLAAVLGGGLVLGFVVFGGNKNQEVASAPPTPTPPTPTPPTPTPPKPPVQKIVTPQKPASIDAGTPVPTPKPPDTNTASTATADILTLSHPVLENVVSHSHGIVATVKPASTVPVAVGDRLFTVRFKQSGGAQVEELTKRVKELEGLAQQDPAAYQPFLDRAKRELEQAQPVELTPVRATSAGVLDAKVKVGDKVEPGAVLGVMLDPKTWIAIGTVHGASPTANWSCAVATPDNTHTALCKIQTTEAVAGDGGTRVTVEISTVGVPWLTDLRQHPRIVLESVH